jgi:hypothetical protein
MNEKLKFDIELTDEVLTKVQLLAHEHSVKVEDYVVELIRETIPESSTTIEKVNEERNF